MNVSSPALLHANEWRTLVPPEGSVWTPTRSVSVCIPTGPPGPGLANTLRCLAAQTYPSDLFDVVIGCDGVDFAIDVPDDLPFAVSIEERESVPGFGAGRARNTAARNASGEIIVFLDADVIPERQVIECYARWFDLNELAMPMGLCRFVDTSTRPVEALVEAFESGTVEELFDGQDVDDQSYRERTFARTRDLHDEAIDAFRVTIGATNAVHRDQLEQIGGYPERGVRGIEDTEYGFRLHNNGALLILDRDAEHWHQGPRHLSSDRREEIDRERRPFVERVIPVPGFRRAEPEPIAGISVAPVFRVYIEGDDPHQRARTITSVAMHDGVNIVVEDGVVDASEFDDAFGVVTVPAGTEWGPATRRALLDIFREQRVGVVRVGARGSANEVVAMRTRCVRRAHHDDPTGDTVLAAEARFGLWMTTAEVLDLALGLVDDPPAAASAPSIEPADGDPDAASTGPSGLRRSYLRVRGKLRRRLRNRLATITVWLTDKLREWAS